MFMNVKIRAMGLAVALCASVEAYTVFTEDFDAMLPGAVDGQNEWRTESGTATVQTNIAKNFQSMEMGTAFVSRSISSSEKSLWLTCWVRYSALPDEVEIIPPANSSVAFYLAPNQHLVVYSNTVPIELAATVSPTVWTRFDIYCDYETQQWNLNVNGVNVAAGLPLYSNGSNIKSLLFRNAGEALVHIDEISVSDVEPGVGTLDTDTDSIPDWWEQKYFGGITVASASAMASNGVNTLLEAYIAGLNPMLQERFRVYPLSEGTGLRWDALPSRRYSVYWTPSLTSSFMLKTNLPPDVTHFIDSGSSLESSSFYQLKVERF